MRLIATILLCLMVGCTTGRHLDLEERWGPLIAVEEGTDKLFAEGMTTTIGHYCYVSDMKQWKLDYPEGSPDREALLLHEQVHAKRELATGLTVWLTLYVTSAKFRWQEEQIGYELQIRHMYKNGRGINAEIFAKMLSQEYQSLGGQMVSYEEALKWLQDLVTRIGQGN